MNVSSTLYTLAAIGFFALMASRPMIEVPSAASTMTTPVATETNPSDTMSEPSETASSTPATAATTPNEPPQEGNTSSDTQQPASTNTN